MPRGLVTVISENTGMCMLRYENSLNSMISVFSSYRTRYFARHICICVPLENDNQQQSCLLNKGN